MGQIADSFGPSRRSGCLLHRPPRLHHWQLFLREQFQPALRDLVGRAAEAEGDVHLEVAQHLPLRLEAAQDLVGRPPLTVCMKPDTAPSGPLLRAISAFCW